MPKSYLSLLAATATSLILPTTQAQDVTTSINTCESPEVQTEFGEVLLLDRFTTVSTNSIDAMLPFVQDGCAVAYDEAGANPTMGLWMALTVPGTSDMEYPMTIEIMNGYSATMAVFLDDCDELYCVDSQYLDYGRDDIITNGSSVVEASLDWTAVGGETYRIFITQIADGTPEEVFVNSIPLRIHMLDSYIHCTLIAMPAALASNDYQPSCSCDEVGADVTVLTCQDECAHCHLETTNDNDEDGDEETYCHYVATEQSFEQVFGSIHEKEFQHCYILSDGYSNSGESICENLFATAATNNNDQAETMECTLSLGGENCKSCTITDPSSTDGCVEAEAEATNLFTADCSNIIEGADAIMTTWCNSSIVFPAMTDDTEWATDFYQLKSFSGANNMVGRCASDGDGDDEGRTDIFTNLTATTTPELVTTVPPTNTAPDASDTIIELTFQTPSRSFTLDPTGKKTFQLGVNATQHPMVRCFVTSEGGVPELEISEHSPTGSASVCEGSSNECRIRVQPNTTDHMITVSSDGVAVSESITLRCEAYTSELQLGVPSERLNNMATADIDEMQWFLLDVSERDGSFESATVHCDMMSDNGTPKLIVYEDYQGSMEFCQGTPNIDTNNMWECQSYIFPGTEVFWIGVSAVSMSENVTIRCYPVYGSAQYLTPGSTSSAFDLGLDQSLTFATEIGPGEAAFCWIGEVDDGRIALGFTDQDLVLGVNLPPDLPSDNYFCRSDDFSEDNDVCFAYGDTTERSVVYTTVYSNTGATSMTVTCDVTKHFEIGTTSSTSFMLLDRFQSFVIEVPSAVSRLTCTTDVDEGGDIDVYFKLGESLADLEFDCIGPSEESTTRECELSIDSNGSSPSSVIVILYSAEGTGVVLTCFDPEEGLADGATTVNRGDPDLS